MINDVVRIKEGQGEEVEESYFYETSVDHKLTERQMRWPREALRRIFGLSPWVFREWACLRLENKLRFQEGHPDDFELLDIRTFVLELWKCWLYDERNKEFRELFERVGPSGQAELVHHIMTPFELMHDVITNEDEQWDFEDSGVSIFTYVSLLGSGFLDAFVIFLLQLSMPIIIFF